MELVTVGNGDGRPVGHRTSACHWLSRGNLKILLDCGPGALHRLAEFGLPWHQVTHVVLSHFHPTIGRAADAGVRVEVHHGAVAHGAARDPRPPGVVRLVKTLAQGYGPWLLDPGFPIGILDVRDGDPFRSTPR